MLHHAVKILLFVDHVVFCKKLVSRLRNCKTVSMSMMEVICWFQIPE